MKPENAISAGLRWLRSTGANPALRQDADELERARIIVGALERRRAPQAVLSVARVALIHLERVLGGGGQEVPPPRKREEEEGLEPDVDSTEDADACQSEAGASGDGDHEEDTDGDDSSGAEVA